MKDNTIVVIDGILGGCAISLGVILSNMVAHPIISPLVFSVGILICVHLNLGLITRAIPIGMSGIGCLVTYLANFLSAGVLGCYTSDLLSYPELSPTLDGAILTGIIIGLVALANRYKSDYSVLITMILMWTFVYLKLPHCVVYAYWFPTGAVDIKGVALVTLGNIIGGAIVRFSDSYIIRRESEKNH